MDKHPIAGLDMNFLVQKQKENALQITNKSLQITNKSSHSL